MSDHRIFGLETEFGCFVRDPSVGSPEEVVERVKNAAFLKRRLGLLDLHSRDYAFEPARAGGFLVNGARLYIDVVGSHLEYATPECSSVRELVLYDRAGRALVQSLLADLGLDDSVSFHNNSVDHFGGHTFGCHENYLVRWGEHGLARVIVGVLPFLITRQIFAGVGRVGGHRLTRPSSRSNILTVGEHEVDFMWVSNFYGVEIDPTVEFQLSQRADHIVRPVSSRVRFNRAIVNPKWDGYYVYGNLHRLHLLFGESNCSEYACMLKVGTTALVLEMIEEFMNPDGLAIENPMMTLRQISRDPTHKWVVTLEDGRTIRAVDVQRMYLNVARRYLSGRDEETDWIIGEWERTLDDLETDPLSTADRLDWSAKKVLYDGYVESEGISWSDDILHSLDLEYHNVNPAVSLHAALEQEGSLLRYTHDFDVATAMVEPPETTRAYGRGRILSGLLEHVPPRYLVDWESVSVAPHYEIRMRRPFYPYAEEAENFLAMIARGRAGSEVD